MKKKYLQFCSNSYSYILIQFYQCLFVLPFQSFALMDVVIIVYLTSADFFIHIILLLFRNGEIYSYEQNNSYQQYADSRGAKIGQNNSKQVKSWRDVYYTSQLVLL